MTPSPVVGCHVMWDPNPGYPPAWPTMVPRSGSADTNSPNPYPPAEMPGSASGAWAGTSGPNARWTCCISRRALRRSGWPPSGSSRAGKASVNPDTQRARSSTEVKMPPIAASAPYGSVPSRTYASSRRT